MLVMTKPDRDFVIELSIETGAISNSPPGAAGGAAKLKDLTQQQILFTKISGLHPLISKHSIIITALSLLLTDSSASCFPSSQCSTNLK